MNPRAHRVATANSLFWLPWGLVCLVWPTAWSGQVITGMNVFDLSDAVARTEVRAMYGGLQMAIGIFALIGAFRPKHRESMLLFFVLALTGLAMYELPNMLLAWALFLLRPRRAYSTSGLASASTGG